jgi:hypothetical protein
MTQRTLPIWVSPLQSALETVSILSVNSAMSKVSGTTTTTNSSSGNRPTRNRSVNATPIPQSSKGTINSKGSTTDNTAPTTDPTTTRKSTPQHTAQVTPTEHHPTDDCFPFSNKQVRFNGKEEGTPILSQTEVAIASETSSTSDKVPKSGGFVSRRGRYVSPGRRTTGSSSSFSHAATSLSASTSPSSPSSTSPRPQERSSSATKSVSTDTKVSSVLQYETYRSPDHSAVPSLCSAPSQEDMKVPAQDKGSNEVRDCLLTLPSDCPSVPVFLHLFCGMDRAAGIKITSKGFRTVDRIHNAREEPNGTFLDVTFCRCRSRSICRS